MFILRDTTQEHIWAHVGASAGSDLLVHLLSNPVPQSRACPDNPFLNRRECALTPAPLHRGAEGTGNRGGDPIMGAVGAGGPS